MNSLAVALAADSAVTVTRQGEEKVYKSAIKLFMLSEHQPVGVMTYSNASLLGVPWETVIKLFRRQLGAQELPLLEDYGKAFLKFLDRNARLFPPAVQQKFFLDLIRGRFEALFDVIQEGVLRKVFESGEPEEDGAVDAPGLREDVKRVVLGERDRLQALPDSTCFEPAVAQSMLTRASGKVHDITREVFQSLELDGETITALTQLAGFYVFKNEIAPETLSGVVIAGFGADDHFPKMQSFEIGEVYGDRLKYVARHEVAIDQDKPSYVEPFADSEMVNTFLFGINAAFEVRVLEAVTAMTVGLLENTIDVMPSLDATQKDYWKRQALGAQDAAMGELWDKLEAYRKSKHLDPIHDAIRDLPKDELAQVAASLVNLNLFQKRMSLDAETVGGPIDVAVISKGDGFVWIDRKHYFKPELNQHFLSRYRRAPHAETPKPEDPAPRSNSKPAARRGGAAGRADR